MIVLSLWLYVQQFQYLCKKIRMTAIFLSVARFTSSKHTSLAHSTNVSVTDIKHSEMRAWLWAIICTMHSNIFCLINKTTVPKQVRKQGNTLYTWLNTHCLYAYWLSIQWKNNRIQCIFSSINYGSPNMTVLFTIVKLW